MKKIFNSEYSSLWKEIPLFIMCALLKRDKAAKNSNRILIVNTCLMGEFAASVPATVDFIERHTDKNVDMLVSPPLKSLAQKIKGVKNVYVAKSVYGRLLEYSDESELVNIEYEEVIVLMVSLDAYKFLKNLKIYKVKTAIWYFTTYATHLLKNNILRRTPKQWRTLNFEMLGGVPRDIHFDDMFFVKNDDYNVLANLPVTILPGDISTKTIIIHTGASWPMMYWEKDNWIALLQKINKLGSFRFIFIGTKKEEQDYEYISSGLDFKIYSIISKVDRLQLMLALKSADYFIGIDSGPANVAHLVNLRSIVIFGPGPHMYMPNNPSDIALDKSNGRGMYQRFFIKNHGFIHQITPDEVYAAFCRMK